MKKPAPWHPWRNGTLPAERQPPRVPAPPATPAPDPFAPRHWWTAQRAMVALDVSRSTINRLCREGQLVGKLVPRPGGKAGAGVRLVDPASVRAYQERRAKRRAEIEANVPNRSNATNHGWPIAEYTAKLREY